MAVYKIENSFFEANSKKELVEYFQKKGKLYNDKDISLIEASFVKKIEPGVYEVDGIQVENLRIIMNIERDIEVAIKNLGFLTNESIPESKKFIIGDKVSYGVKNDPWTVIDSFQDGRVFLIAHRHELRVLSWVDMFPYSEEINDSTHFREEESLRLSFGNTMLKGLMGRYYFFGCDMDPVYQRGLEWSLEDKQLLIDSIFKNIEIGKFVFIINEVRGLGEKTYEILDGKQRLNAIREFLEDRFTYKGYLFSELGSRDQDFFTNKNIAYADVERKYVNDQVIVEYFLRLNQGGVSVSKEHLDKIKKQFNIEE